MYFQQPARPAATAVINPPSAARELDVLNRDLAELERKIERRQIHRDQLAAELGQGTAPETVYTESWQGPSRAAANAALLADYDRDTAILTRERDALDQRAAAIKAGAGK